MYYYSKIQRILKYVLFFIIIYLILAYMPYTKLTTNEILLVSFSITIIFALIDMAYPAVIIKNSL